MEKKSGYKNCEYCNNSIKINKDKFVLLGTYTGEDTEEESYFHFDCFVEWYNKRVLEKAKTQVRGFQQKAHALFSKLAGSGVLSNIAGMDNLQRMLSTDLGEKEVGEFEDGVPTVDEMFGGDPKKKKKKTKKKPKTFEEEVAKLPQ